MHFNTRKLKLRLGSDLEDAGFGIKAAASRFGLHFIPLLEENYLFAIRRDLAAKTVAPLESIITSSAFKSYARGLPGYDVKQTGKSVRLEDIFGTS